MAQDSRSIVAKYLHIMCEIYIRVLIFLNQLRNDYIHVKDICKYVNEKDLCKVALNWSKNWEML